MVIGVTGGYCAGKDAAVSVLSRLGIIEINEDRIGHETLHVLKNRIVDEFGIRIQKSNGEIDRKVLGTIVFSDQKDLERLERIVHPAMVAETRKRITQERERNLMINAAILHRMGLHLLCDVVLVINAPFLVRFIRAKKRDGLSCRQTFQRMRTQRLQRQNTVIENRFLNEKGENVDTVIVRNGGTRSALAKRLRRVLSELGITGR